MNRELYEESHAHGVIAHHHDVWRDESGRLDVEREAVKSHSAHKDGMHITHQRTEEHANDAKRRGK